ncbi:MAG: hypothetical protein HQ512_14685 [Rhodospirillales bacterium]|nr:hypothetical protein [Rhodospirillales bacterium]
MMNKPSALSDTLSTAIKNPSREVAKRLLSFAGDGGIRGVIDRETYDIFVWKATEYTLNQVAESLNRGLINQMSLFMFNTSEQIDTMIVWPEN